MPTKKSVCSRFFYLKKISKMKKTVYHLSSELLTAPKLQGRGSSCSAESLPFRVLSNGSSGRRLGLLFLAVVTLLLNFKATSSAQSTVHVYSDLAETNYIAGYSTIQAAVNNATTLSGYVVRVDAGTYTENVLITKTLDIRGANYGISASTAALRATRGSESIINGAFSIGNVSNVASNVKIDGFKFIGSAVTFTDRTKVAVVRGLNAKIQNNIFDSELAASTNFQVSGQSTFGITTGGGYDQTGLEVKDNYFVRLRSGVFTNPSLSTTQLYSNNQFSSRTGINFDHSGTSPYYATVSNNNFAEVTVGSDVVGPVTTVNCTALFANSNMQFTGNVIESNFVGIDFKDIRSGAIVNVSNNSFGKRSSASGVTHHLWVRLNASTSVTINNNSFVDMGTGAAITNAGASQINAECNWYGAASNPSSKISGSVDFNAWLVSGTDSDGVTIGFQPETGVCTGTPVVIASTTPTAALCGLAGSIDVTYSGGAGPYDIAWTGGSATDVTSPYTISDLAAGAYGITVTDANGSTDEETGVNILYLPVHNTTADTRHATIQAAVNAASANDIIAVCAGTYNEQVQLGSMPLSLRGANYGIPGDGDRQPESIVTGSTFGFFLNASVNVTIDGFSVVGTGLSSSRGILLGNTSETPGPVTLSNNIISGAWTTGLSLAGGAYSGWVSNVTITGNKFQNNGIGSTENATNLTIQNNTFIGAGISLGSGAAMAAAISGNDFSGSTGSGRYVSIATGVTLFGGQDLDGILSANTFDKYAAVFAATGSWYNQAVFASITGAIAAAATDAVIKVSANTFNEDVTVNKKVDLRGPNYLITWDGVRQTEAVIDGNIVVSAAGAGFSGFEINRSNLPANNWLMQVTSGETTVSNNIIKIGTVQSSTQQGFIRLNTSSGTVNFTGNEFTMATPGSFPVNTGINGLLTQGSGTYNITGNRIAVSGGPTQDADAVGITGGTVIFNDNLVEGDIMGGVAAYGNFGNVQITNNTIKDYTTALAGIRVVNCCSYNSANAAVTITGNFVQGASGTTGIGIIDAPAGDIVNLSSNSITDNTTSVKHTGSGTLDATCNWFGTTDVAAIAASITGNVTYQPYLGSGTDSDPVTAGFQPSSGAQPGYVTAVTGNGQPISNGSTTYSATNLTLMGSAPVGGSLVRNYSFTTATSCGASNGATFTSLTFTGAAAARFSFGDVVTGTEYTPGTYNFTIAYTAHTEEIEDEVICVMTTESGVYTFGLKAVTTPPSPAVAEIRGNNVLISNGDFSPSLSDHTDFGTLALPGTLTRTFTVTNAGPTSCQPLTVSAVTFEGGDYDKFSVTGNTCTSALESGESCTFTVTFTSGPVGGIFNTTIRVDNTDPARDPYEYAISARLLSPDLSVTGNNTGITNGDNTPQTSDHTLMGTVVAGQTIDRTYTLKNLGLGNLNIGANAVALSAAPAPQNSGSSNFSIITQPAEGVYTTNQETFFTLRYTSPGQGQFYALVTLTTQNAGTFTFVVQGNGPSPRMQVLGNSVDIPSGTTAVSTADGTNFGARALNTNTDRIFSVRNPGGLGAAAPLNLTGSPRVVLSGAGAAMFIVTIQPGATIGVNSSTTFRIRFRPTSAGCHYATVSIASDDPARNPYTFRVFGKTTGASCSDYAPSPVEEEFSLADGFEVALSAGDEEIEASPRGLENIASEMMLYPNPATDRVLMEVPVSEENQFISFINVSGITVYSISTKGGLHNIDLAGFAPGVYFVVSSDRTVQPKRLVKL
jgi:hypothetical protein